MPITNPEEIETLSPLGEGLALEIHAIIKENIRIGTESCLDKPSDHEGFYRENGECFECAFKGEYGVALGIALRTFLEPRISPWKYRTFVGRFNHEDWGADTCFAKGCPRCGTNLRYAQGSMSVCVFCSGMKVAQHEGAEAMLRWSQQADHPIPPSSHWDRFLRDTALANGHSTYQGKPCEKHGTDVTRYTNTGRCAACVKKHNTIYQETIKKTATDFPAAASDFDGLFD